MILCVINYVVPIPLNCQIKFFFLLLQIYNIQLLTNTIGDDVQTMYV